uniref:AlNc14C233G9341 protein n=1 Tax=Albugo laibachii Nc14 TaxID=890382 RepID=F0WSJ6_9STRA|nr:AlNc14C233G9341 [Albugo laibachii Nc14]|eukprot:CCA24322.1 AlNc14C233G9341 [Albugo laibachii Nc14]
MHGVLLACMDSNDPALDDLAHVLMINRLFAANNLNEDVTFATRWRRHVSGKIPSKSQVVFQKFSSWWTSAPAGLQELTRAAQAIAFIELFHICVAPTLYTNDHWIH